MRRMVIACALVALLPAGAWGDPITVELHSATGGFSADGNITTGHATVGLGHMVLPGTEAVGTFFFNNAHTWRDYIVSFDLSLSGAGGFRVELLDPIGDGDDAYDPIQPAWMPEGWSSSNDYDGFSFAQRSGLERSATFAGGSATVIADEDTHRGDILLFTGLDGVDQARVTFGIRDSGGYRPFLLHVAAIGFDTSAAPEPGTMLLLGTGLAGVAAAVRRRRRMREAQTSA
jgi:hypothetical protein